VNKLVSTPAHNRPRIHLSQIQNMGNEGGNKAVHNPRSPPPSPSKRRFLQFYKVLYRNKEQVYGVWRGWTMSLRVKCVSV